MSGDRVVARSVDSAWRCDVCGERFTSNYMRQEHVQRDHPMTAPSPAAAGLPAEDVERVARALWEAASDHPDRPVWPEVGSALRDYYRRLAAAALAEMRPTATEEAVAHCTARIWPSWSDRWIRCNSPVGPNGRCQKYRHTPVPPDANGGERR